MEKIEFRPRRIVLSIWSLWTIIVSIATGAISALIAYSATAEPDITLAGFLWGCIPINAIFISYFTLYFFSIKYSLDDKYIVKDSGVLWRRRRSVPLEKITNIDVRQGPLERIIGYGKILIFTPSTGARIPEMKIFGVDDPHGMKQRIIENSIHT